MSLDAEQIGQIWAFSEGLQPDHFGGASHSVPGSGCQTPNMRAMEVVSRLLQEEFWRRTTILSRTQEEKKTGKGLYTRPVRT